MSTSPFQFKEMDRCTCADRFRLKPRMGVSRSRMSAWLSVAAGIRITNLSAITPTSESIFLTRDCFKKNCPKCSLKMSRGWKSWQKAMDHSAFRVSSQSMIQTGGFDFVGGAHLCAVAVVQLANLFVMIHTSRTASPQNNPDLECLGDWSGIDGILPLNFATGSPA